MHHGSVTAAAPTDLPVSTGLTALQWSAKLAAFLGRGAAEDDPRVRACRAALAYWRCRRVIDAERDALDPADAAVLQEALR